MPLAPGRTRVVRTPAPVTTNLEGAFWYAGGLRARVGALQQIWLETVFKQCSRETGASLMRTDRPGAVASVTCSMAQHLSQAEVRSKRREASCAAWPSRACARAAHPP